MNPPPRPLASVTRIPTAAEQTMAMVPAYELAAMHALCATAAEFVAEVHNRQRKGWEKVPEWKFDQLAARVSALARVMEIQ